MPLPTPEKGEKESHFVSRCVASDVVQKDFKTQEQRLAVCYSQFKRHKHKKAKGADEPANPYEDIIIFITDSK